MPNSFAQLPFVMLHHTSRVMQIRGRQWLVHETIKLYRIQKLIGCLMHACSSEQRTLDSRPVARSVLLEDLHPWSTVLASYFDIISSFVSFPLLVIDQPVLQLKPLVSQGPVFGIETDDCLCWRGRSFLNFPHAVPCALCHWSGVCNRASALSSLSWPLFYCFVIPVYR